jgi:hypothetical protein
VQTTEEIMSSKVHLLSRSYVPLLHSSDEELENNLSDLMQHYKHAYKVLYHNEELWISRYEAHSTNFMRTLVKLPEISNKSLITQVLITQVFWTLQHFCYGSYTRTAEVRR